MIRWLLGAGAAAVATLGLAGVVASQPATSRQMPAATPSAAASPDQIARGKYLVTAGDCMACHTKPGEAAFAGGRPVPTPFGTILSANITPDKTGIGDWTADEFYRALYTGIDDEGKHLYPAFPYTDYTKVTRADADAMFAYLRSIPPVRHDFERNKLPFPFNIRALMGVWNWLFFKPGEYRSDPSKSAEWNRGAYLVQGLGHCGACHTPRNLLGGPKRSETFRGGHFAQWFAPDLTTNARTGLGGWSRQDLVEFLKTGINAHSGAAGEMGEVVAFSTSRMSDADVGAMAAYLESLPASPAARAARPSATAMRRGQAIFADECSACHEMDASGVARFFPPLKGDANLQQSDPTTVVRFILDGVRSTPTDARPTGLSMPAFGCKLSDQEVADVATYIRNSAGNIAEPVDAGKVRSLRGKLAPNQRPPPPFAAPHGRPTPQTLAPAQTGSAGGGGGPSEIPGSNGAQSGSRSG